MWTVDDPGQGDPAVVRVLASEFQSTADDAGSAARVLRSLKDQTTDTVWSGSSADEFRSRIGDLPGHLDKLQASYTDAAGALTTYAASVQQIKDDATAQQKLIASANSDHQQATTAQTTWVAPVDPATGAPDPTAKNPHDEAVAQATARMNQSTAKLHALGDTRKAADAKVIATLHQAHDAGMKNKSLFQKFLSVASDVLAKITVVLLVIAVVAIVVLAIVQPELIPGLLLLGGQILTGLSAAQLAIDGTRKAMGDNVSWGTMGLEALGCLPVVGQLAKGAGLTAKAAEALAPAIARGRAVLDGAADALRASRLRVVGDAGELNLSAFGRGGKDVAWEGEGLTLNATDNATVDRFLAKAAEAEPGITSKLGSIEDGLPNSKLEGLEYRLKGEDSLKRKIAQEIKLKGGTAEDHLHKINDSVRYTFDTKFEHYGTEAQSGFNQLKSAGFEQVGETKNFWARDGYQGVNTTWHDPASGHTFEMQFHTPDSHAAKELTHEIYEEQRLLEPFSPEWNELQRQQNEVFSWVPTPENATTVGIGGP